MNPILTAFSLEETALCSVLHAANAVIFGGSAISWHRKKMFDSRQDLDIACQPDSATRPLVYALFDMLFRTAGYKPGPDGSADYRSLSIVAVHNWERLTPRYQKIQLVIRKPRAPPVAYDMDLDICGLTVEPTSPSNLVVRFPPGVTETSLAAGLMHLNRMENQHSLGLLEKRLHKYYTRGFTLLTDDNLPLKSRRQALDYLRKAWVAANPLSPTDLARADTLCDLVKDLLTGMEDPSVLSDSILTRLHTQLRSALCSTHTAALCPTSQPTIDKYLKLIWGIHGAKKIVSTFTREGYAKISSGKEFRDALCLKEDFPELYERVNAQMALLTGSAGAGAGAGGPVGACAGAGAGAGGTKPYLSVEEVEDEEEETLILRPCPAKKSLKKKPFF
jgi:hypothetical protein